MASERRLPAGRSAGNLPADATEGGSPYTPAVRSLNPGLLWLDEPDAHAVIAARLGAGEISASEADNLRKFADDGYCILRLELSGDDAASFDGDVDRLWRQRPRNVSVAYDSPPFLFSSADAASQRKPRYRIHDLHSASDVAMRLYLDPTLARYAALILGETAVATQSLYFEFGSQQPLHRDSIVVPTPKFGQLMASWIAMEDIDDRSGPLVYVPGSHRLPFFSFSPGKVVYDPTCMGDEDVRAAMKFYDDVLSASGLETKLFLAKRGEVLLWHSALMHGGGAVGDERLTRKSFVVHYSALAQQRVRDCAVREAPDSADQSVFTTTDIVERAGAFGFANPLDGRFAYRR